MTRIESVVIHTDGASRGNPGPASIGVVIADEDGRVLLELGEALRPTTNNVAEYTAVIRALERAAELGARRVRAMMDSQLVVRQLNGNYRVKHPDMIPLYRRVLELIQRFDSVTFEHVPREENVEADRMANQALDGGGAAGAGLASSESVVAGLLRALIEDRPADARIFLAESFRFERTTGKQQDGQEFAAGWQGKAQPWSVKAVRTAGAETILEAELQGVAIVWLCSVTDGRVVRLVEYRDTGH